MLENSAVSACDGFRERCLLALGIRVLPLCFDSMKLPRDEVGNGRRSNSCLRWTSERNSHGLIFARSLHSCLPASVRSGCACGARSC